MAIRTARIATILAHSAHVITLPGQLPWAAYHWASEGEGVGLLPIRVCFPLLPSDSRDDDGLCASPILTLWPYSGLVVFSGSLNRDRGR